MKNETTKKGTSTLFRGIFKTSNINKYIEKNLQQMDIPSFPQYINSLCKEKNKLPADIIKLSNLERSFGYQIFKGSKNPSRDTVIQIAFGFEAEVEQAQILLKYAKMSALYPRIKRDTVIIYCLHNHHTIIETQDILLELELPLIGMKS